jgi:hypothetical protein
LRPVLQTRHGPGGNCYAACVASILETSLDDVPDLCGDAQWGEKLRAWCRARRVTVRFLPGNAPAPQGWAIAGVRVLTGSIHAVVCLNGRIVHDPSPRPLTTPQSPVRLWTLLESEPPHDC